MKNFTFLEENNDPGGRGRRHPRIRRHHEPHSPTGDGDFPHGHERDHGLGDEGPRGGGRPGGRGFGPGGRRGPGFGPGFGPGPGGRGGRVRKGNVRSAILSLLSQHSYNGYGMIRAIAMHTDGAWRPSPGSVYPTLAALQAEGLIETSEEGKRTEFSLTAVGKAYVAENSEEMAQVWADVNEEAGAGTELRAGMHKLGGAVQQIAMAGTEEQIKSATEALDAARRTIYQLLAD